jgi:hypothetical protein
MLHLLFHISLSVFQPGSHSDRRCRALAFSQNLTESSQAALISAKTSSPSFLRFTTTKCRQPKVSCIAVHLEPIKCGNFCFLGISPHKKMRLAAFFMSNQYRHHHYRRHRHRHS